MKTLATRFGIVLLATLFAASAVVAAQGTPAPLGIIPTPTPTPQPLSASIWTDDTMYAIGETVTIYFSVSQAAYVYIYDIQPDGIVRLIYPNAYSQNNFKAAGTHALPDGQYQFTVAPPTGTEQLQIFASTTNLGLNPSVFYEAFPLAGNNPQAATGQIQAQIMGIVPTPTWVTNWTSFTIVSSYGYSPPSYSPPSYSQPGYYPPYYPPFFGVPGATWYYQNGEWHYGLPSSGWYWYFGEDGRWHFRIHIQFNFGG